MTKITYIPGEIANAAIDEHGNRKPVTRTQHIFDDDKGKSQAEVNADVDDTFALHQSEINALDSQNYITVDTFTELPATGETDTIYRVANYDGTQVVTNKYAEYAWNGTQYKLLDVKEYGIDDEPTAGSDNLVKSGGTSLNILNNKSYLKNSTPIGITKKGYYINTGVNIGETVDVNNPVSGSIWSYSITEVEQGDICVINGNGGSAPSLWALLDANYKLISAETSTAMITNRLLNINLANIKYLIINDKTESVSYITRGKSLDNIVSSVMKNGIIPSQLLVSCIQNGIKINAEGEFVEATGYTLVRYYIPTASYFYIKTNKHYYIVGYSSDNENSFVDFVTNGGTGENIYKIDSGISYVLICFSESVTSTDITNMVIFSSDIMSDIYLKLALSAVYDVSAKNPTAGPNNDGKWESLSALLSDANLSTLIPTSVRKSGMSIKFSSDNKYVQFRYMSTSTAVADFTNVANWQGVDEVPASRGRNLVESGGVDFANFDNRSYIKKKTPVSITKSGYYLPCDTVGAVVDVNNPTSGAIWNYSLIEVSEGDKFIINGQGGSAPRLWALLDEDYKVVVNESSTAYQSDRIVRIIAGVRYIIINSKTSDLSYIERYNSLEVIEDELDKQGFVKLKAISESIRNKYGFDANGAITSKTYYSALSYFIPVKKYVYVNCPIGYGIAGYSAANESSFVSYIQVSVVSGENIFEIPNTVNYIRLFLNDNAITSETVYNTLILHSSDVISYIYEKIQNLQNSIIPLINDDINIKRSVISNTNDYLCGSAANTYYDVNKGLLYTVYLTSKTGYGEQHDIVALSVTPITQPSLTEFYECCKKNETIGDFTVVNPTEPNIYFIDNKIFVSWYNEDGSDGDNSKKYCARIFDLSTKTFGNVIELKLKNGNDVVDFNDANIIAYVRGTGSSNIATFYTFTSKIVKHGNIYYGAISGYRGAPVIVTSTDGIIWELHGVVPVTAYYETQIAFLGETMVIINRGADVNSGYQFVSSDYGDTFSGLTAIAVNDTRPQLYSYKNKLLSIIGKGIGTSDYSPSNRQIIEIRLGDSTTIANNEVVLTLASKYGIVYPSVFSNGDDLYFAFSNGERFFSIENPPTAKDQICLYRIGEL